MMVKEIQIEMSDGRAYQYSDEYQRLTAPVDYTVPYLYGIMGISAVVCTVLLLTGVA